MSRCVVNVATGRYIAGQERLRKALNGSDYLMFADQMPAGSPSHDRVPYAFKAFALREAWERGYTSLLWADASIVPIRSLDPLWERIESEGYWISRNGWTNYEWTTRGAYQDLGVTEEENKQIPHVVATAFGLNLESQIGHAFFMEYFRLASQTRAFCGPWVGGVGVQHRHDQTAASVIAHRLGMQLTNPPAWFAYRGGERDDTILVADGNY